MTSDPSGLLMHETRLDMIEKYLARERDGVPLEGIMVRLLLETQRAEHEREMEILRRSIQQP